MTRAPLATAQRIALASASTGIDRCGPTTFATSSSAGGCEPGDADAVVRLRRDQAGDERPVPLGVDGGGPGDEALRGGDPAAQLRVRAVDAGVDHGDPDRARAAAAPSTRRTTGSASRTTAVAGAGRSGRTTAAGSAAARRSARRARPAAPSADGAETASAGIGARSTTSVAPRARELLARPRRDRRPARSRRRTGPLRRSDATARPSATAPTETAALAITSAVPAGR